MNHFIEDELNKCVSAKSEKIKDNTFLIRKNIEELPTDIEQHHFYQIEVEDYIIHPYKGFSLHEDWNNGIPPTSKNMQVEVDQIIGKMIHINALGDDGLIWNGWLPRKSIKIKRMIM